MKNIFKTLTLFLTAGALLASCDSYLDRQPDEPLTSENIFTDVFARSAAFVTHILSSDI